MYHITERNERNGRRHALVLAIALHLALAAMLYFMNTSDSPGSNSIKVNSPKEMPVPKARTVQMP